MDAIVKRDLESIIDSSRLSDFQIAIIVLCALVAMMDGFDTQSIAFVAPEIAAAWHVAPASFGPVFGIGLFGIISTRSACRSAAT
jgi:MFS transporter, AAHS family, 4-hydroxybenzoate transporter